MVHDAKTNSGSKLPHVYIKLIVVNTIALQKLQKVSSMGPTIKDWGGCSKQLVKNALNTNRSVHAVGVIRDQVK